jgi:hypothetical protein
MRRCVNKVALLLTVLGTVSRIPAGAQTVGEGNAPEGAEARLESISAADIPEPEQDRLQGLQLIRVPGGGRQRMMGVLPNNRTVQAVAEYKPLSTKEKFTLARRDAFDWPNYLLLASFAVQNDLAWGGGAKGNRVAGFGKFYGRAVGDQIIGTYLTEAIAPSLFREDPRYFRLGEASGKSAWQRAGYAASRVLVSRRPDGHWGWNRTEFLGNAAALGIGTAYYPMSRSWSAVGERLSMQLANDAFSNLMAEFWPDVRRRLHFGKKKTPEAR